jgi:hypothetical protein
MDTSKRAISRARSEETPHWLHLRNDGAPSCFRPETICNPAFLLICRALQGEKDGYVF